MDVFATTALQEALAVDSTHDTFQMTRYVDSPNILGNIFDDNKIIYEKG